VKHPEGAETPARKTAAGSSAAGGKTEAEIAAYLEAHPDFVQRHPALLQTLVPPAMDRGRGIVDFQRYMVTRLQSDIARTGAEQTAMIQTARANAHNQSRIHQAVLALVEAPSLGHVIEVLTGDLAVMLDVDVIAMLVESNGADLPHVTASGIRVVEPGAVAAWLGRRDVTLRGGIAGDPAIFGPAAGLVKSEALLRLAVSRHTPVGLLAFGSRESEMFQEGQGTELIGFLGGVVERLIRRWLDLPA
jgi:uncharacterized protein YigA (DUF484 family)